MYGFKQKPIASIGCVFGSRRRHTFTRRRVICLVYNAVGLTARTVPIARLVADWVADDKLDIGHLITVVAAVKHDRLAGVPHPERLLMATLQPLRHSPGSPLPPAYYGRMEQLHGHLYHDDSCPVRWGPFELHVPELRRPPIAKRSTVVSPDGPAGSQASLEAGRQA